MFNTFPHPCVVIDVLVGVPAPITMDMFVEVEVVVIRVQTNVVVDSLFDVMANDLGDVFIDVYADILLEVGVSDVRIIVVSTLVIALKFAVPVSCAGDDLSTMLVGAFCEVNVNVLAAVMTVDIDMLTPLEKLLLLC